MMLLESLQQRFGDLIQDYTIFKDEITIEIPKEALKDVCLVLREEEPFRFEQLMDVCGIDYLEYGITQWQTDKATGVGFERAVAIENNKESIIKWEKPRFAVVYHLLSLSYNQRLRLRVFPDPESLQVESIVSLWPAANWFEREAFDLFGIVFVHHPDLRRILTDYGFIGYPFRKDFPIIGKVEVRYDAGQQAVIYEGVSIEDRVLNPKVIRLDYPTPTSLFNKLGSTGENTGG